MKKTPNSLNEKSNPKKQSTWKAELGEGLKELAFWLLVFCISVLLVFLVPSEIRKNIPIELFELFWVLSFIISVSVIYFIIHIVKTKIKAKDLRYIHKSFEGKYDLELTTVTRKIDGTDILLIRGKNESGKFELYKDKDSFVFSTEYDSIPAEKIYPKNKDEAMRYIEKFMQGYASSDIN